ncbi:19501_t:CDS:2 [Funneliformis geosporum]|uniref:19501_t:CDS:1 n=1 Tax=Funneliformis geosporum TaxID=1117311 RepID=A0A9W4WU24_9GLOM|nr:19501_t:CDS:2 [Funneliformis geosporum]
MEKLRDEVNKFLGKDNRSPYLKMRQSSLFRKVERCIIDESIKVDNSYTLHQIIENVLMETVKDISQTNFNKIIKTAV